MLQELGSCTGGEAMLMPPPLHFCPHLSSIPPCNRIDEFIHSKKKISSEFEFQEKNFNMYFMQYTRCVKNYLLL